MYRVYYCTFIHVVEARCAEGGVLNTAGFGESWSVGRTVTAVYRVWPWSSFNIERKKKSFMICHWKCKCLHHMYGEDTLFTETKRQHALKLHLQIQGMLEFQVIKILLLQLDEILTACKAFWQLEQGKSLHQGNVSVKETEKTNGAEIFFF